MREGCRSNHDSWFEEKEDHGKKNAHQDEKSCTSSAYTSSIGEESMDDDASSISSSDTADDASSSLSSLSTSFSDRAMYDLSDIMAHLPIKRGLSKFYDGKSESFTSLSRVTSTEDLAKKIAAIPYRKNLKASKSCGTGLNCSYKPYTLPKAVITKKTTTRGSSFSSLSSKRGSFMISTKPPMIPLHKNLEC